MNDAPEPESSSTLDVACLGPDEARARRCPQTPCHG